MVLAMLSTLFVGCKDKNKGDGDIAVIEVKDYGTIKVQLYPDIAPITVENFKGLVKDGFYDGLIFHRVIKDFMIQGGDPEGTGLGGSGKTIKGEFSANGVENDLSHKRGVISMARNNDMNGASSQFFICHKDSTHLDGQYAAFGEVIEGIEVVDKIASVSVDSGDKPIEDVVIDTIYLEGAKKSSEKATEPSETADPEALTPKGEGIEDKIKNVVKAEIEMEDGGVIKLDLYPDIAPVTVNNFVKLAKDGFYDGLIFHRVIKDFMIQGGGFDTANNHKETDSIVGEFSANGIENNLLHTRGVISMARMTTPLDSASGQFFICHVDYPSLNGQYAAFGIVTEGMDIVDKIASVQTDGNDKPLENIVIKTIRITSEIAETEENTEETAAIETGVVTMETTDPAINENLNK